MNPTAFSGVESQTGYSTFFKPECYGYPFLITTSEFPQLDYPGHQVAIAHKKEMLQRLIKLAENTGVPNAEQLGKYLSLLVLGHINFDGLVVRDSSLNARFKNLTTNLSKLLKRSTSKWSVLVTTVVWVKWV